MIMNDLYINVAVDKVQRLMRKKGYHRVFIKGYKTKNEITLLLKKKRIEYQTTTINDGYLITFFCKLT